MILNPEHCCLDCSFLKLSPCRFVAVVMDPAIRGQFLHMPSQEQQHENMHDVLAKYKLPNVIGGIDGCHFSFRERPRKIPEGRNRLADLNRH